METDLAYYTAVPDSNDHGYAASFRRWYHEVRHGSVLSGYQK